MKILIAPNSFKECADSPTISKAIEKYLSNYLKNNRIQMLSKPISDGGDGFLSVCSNYFELERRELSISAPDAVGAWKTEIAVDEFTGTAYIESAKILGLAMLPESRRDPKKLNSSGLGEAILFISENYPKNRKVFIGIGGTATNDMGLGALSRFGLKLLNSQGAEIAPFPYNYKEFDTISFSKKNIPFELCFVTDVNNPLLGINGATRTYGPQKGIKPPEYELFDEFFLKIIELAGKNKDNLLLSGAGGGIAAGFSLFYDVEIISSREFITSKLGINESLEPDIVITGEGMIDEQTFMEKGIGVLLEEFPQKIFYIITGKSNIILKKNNVKIIELSKYFSSIGDSIANYEAGIEIACKEIAGDILFDRKVN